MKPVTKKKTRTAILTPLQVREAIVDWARARQMFPPHWDALATHRGAVQLREDGSAVIKIVVAEETPVQP